MPKLLIVDDETDVREFAVRFFRKRNVDVIAASSGEEAIALIETTVPDLVLLDIAMEGMDGIETLRSLREKGCSFKVIMVTGRKPQEPHAYEECHKLGIHDYIHKPLELDELERIVLRALFPDGTPR